MFGLITEEKHDEIVRGLKEKIASHSKQIIKLCRQLTEAQQIIATQNKQLTEARQSCDSCVELNEKIYKDARAYLIDAAREAYEMELLFKTYLQELDYKYDEDAELF